MDNTTSLIYDTLVDLTQNEPECHAQIRQKLYDQLNLPFEKQIALYTNILAPASSGKLENRADIDSAVDLAAKVLGTK
ncbi:PAS factor family protein [Vibrio alginolyticus]|nr:PAS factor family protein [Vibrio alginolyticus]